MDRHDFDHTKRQPQTRYKNNTLALRLLAGLGFVFGTALLVNALFLD